MTLSPLLRPQRRRPTESSRSSYLPIQWHHPPQQHEFQIDRYTWISEQFQYNRDQHVAGNWRRLSSRVIHDVSISTPPKKTHLTTNFSSSWFTALFAGIRKFKARKATRKSHEVLRQTGFETTLPGRCGRSQSGAQSKKSPAWCGA